MYKVCILLVYITSVYHNALFKKNVKFNIVENRIKFCNAQYSFCCPLNSACPGGCTARPTQPAPSPVALEQ